jgi:hypothetical protein
MITVLNTCLRERELQTQGFVTDGGMCRFVSENFTRVEYKGRGEIMHKEQLDRIEEKLDKILRILGADGNMRLPSEIKREAMATVLQFREKQARKQGK